MAKVSQAKKPNTNNEDVPLRRVPVWSSGLFVFSFKLEFIIFLIASFHLDYILLQLNAPVDCKFDEVPSELVGYKCQANLLNRNRNSSRVVLSIRLLYLGMFFLWLGLFAYYKIYFNKANLIDKILAKIEQKRLQLLLQVISKNSDSALPSNTNTVNKPTHMIKQFIAKIKGATNNSRAKDIQEDLKNLFTTIKDKNLPDGVEITEDDVLSNKWDKPHLKNLDTVSKQRLQFVFKDSKLVRPLTNYFLQHLVMHRCHFFVYIAQLAIVFATNFFTFTGLNRCIFRKDFVLPTEDTGMYFQYEDISCYSFPMSDYECVKPSSTLGFGVSFFLINTMQMFVSLWCVWNFLCLLVVFKRPSVTCNKKHLLNHCHHIHHSYYNLSFGGRFLLHRLSERLTPAQFHALCVGIGSSYEKLSIVVCDRKKIIH